MNTTLHDLIHGLQECENMNPDAVVKIVDGTTIEVHVGEVDYKEKFQSSFIAMRMHHWNRNRDGSMWYFDVFNEEE
jgi:hypothetical protein